LAADPLSVLVTAILVFILLTVAIMMMASMTSTMIGVLIRLLELLELTGLRDLFFISRSGTLSTFSGCSSSSSLKGVREKLA
jgi:hypothetical protein